MDIRDRDDVGDERRPEAGVTPPPPAADDADVHLTLCLLLL